MSGYIGTQPVPQATQTRDAFTATAGQTSFATSGYTPGYLDVYLNGIKLAAADYTASNGSDVVLASGAALDDILEVVAYSSFEAAHVTGADNFTVTGSFTSQGIDDNATSTAMTLDGSGNLLVGKTSNDNGATRGIEVEATGQLNVCNDDALVSRFNRLTSDGDIVSFRKDGSAVGSIGSVSTDSDATSDLYIGGDNTGIRLGVGSDVSAVVPCLQTTGALRNGVTSLGSSNARFKDLYLSGGVYLGGTGSANKLDDYEEGLWTPVIEGSSVAGVGSYAGQYGSYTKVGNMVTANCYVIASSHTGSGSQTKVAGFPFAVASGAYSYSAPSFGEVTNVAKSNDTSLGGYMLPSESRMLVTQMSTTTVGNTSNLPFDTSCAILFTVTYRTS